MVSLYQMHFPRDSLEESNAGLYGAQLYQKLRAASLANRGSEMELKDYPARLREQLLQAQLANQQSQYANQMQAPRAARAEGLAENELASGRANTLYTQLQNRLSQSTMPYNQAKARLGMITDPYKRFQAEQLEAERLGLIPRKQQAQQNQAVSRQASPQNPMLLEAIRNSIAEQAQQEEMGRQQLSGSDQAMQQSPFMQRQEIGSNTEQPQQMQQQDQRQQSISPAQQALQQAFMQRLQQPQQMQQAQQDPQQQYYNNMLEIAGQKPSGDQQFDAFMASRIAENPGAFMKVKQTAEERSNLASQKLNDKSYEQVSQKISSDFNNANEYTNTLDRMMENYKLLEGKGLTGTVGGKTHKIFGSYDAQTKEAMEQFDADSKSLQIQKAAQNFKSRITNFELGFAGGTKPNRTWELNSMQALRDVTKAYQNNVRDEGEFFNEAAKAGMPAQEARTRWNRYVSDNKFWDAKNKRIIEENQGIDAWGKYLLAPEKDLGKLKSMAAKEAPKAESNLADIVDIRLPNGNMAKVKRNNLDKVISLGAILVGGK